ncbi:hypothetical protein [Streptomyces gramineus]|uniref:hypothetical protein n=1 Tax=Streptomyces gramineus TaxID=910542 RepID=UPI00398ABC4F
MSYRVSRRTFLVSAAAVAATAGPVTGGRTATLANTTHYRQKSPQKGEVLVSYSRSPPAPPPPGSASATPAATTGTG